MNRKFLKIEERKLEELLDSYFPETKKAVDRMQEEFNIYISQKKSIKKPKRFTYSQILQELLIWLSPCSNVNRIENDKRFVFQKDKFLITDLFYEKKGCCIAFTSLFIALLRRRSIRAYAAYVLIDADNKDLKYDLDGHVCVVDKNKKHWDCVYFRENKSSQHIKIKILPDEKLISLILANQASKNPEKEQFFLEEAIKLDPQNTRALMNLGAFYARKYSHENALKIYEKVVEIDPNHARAWRRIGEQYEDQEQLEKAIASYERSVSIEPSKEPLFRLIKIYCKKEDYENARIACEKFLKISPNHVGVQDIYKKLKVY